MANETVFRIEIRWGTPYVTEISYEKRTAKFYTGCRIVGHLVNSISHLPARQDAENIRETAVEALAATAGLLRAEMERKQREVNALNSRIGEVDKVLRQLP